MKFLDANHPFFRSLLVRWVTSLAPVVWAAVEFVNDEPIWGLGFAALGAWAFWVLVLKGPGHDS